MNFFEWLARKLVERQNTFDRFIGYKFTLKGLEVTVEQEYDVEQGSKIVVEVYVFSRLLMFVETYDERIEFTGNCHIECM